MATETKFMTNFEAVIFNQSAKHSIFVTSLISTFVFAFPDTGYLWISPPACMRYQIRDQSSPTSYRVECQLNITTTAVIHVHVAGRYIPEEPTRPNLTESSLKRKSRVCLNVYDLVSISIFMKVMMGCTFKSDCKKKIRPRRHFMWSPEFTRLALFSTFSTCRHRHVFVMCTIYTFWLIN